MTWPDRTAADWLTVEDARRRVLALVAPLPPEEVPLHAAPGRALAEPIRATATLPPWDNSAMDGYAVHGTEIAGATPDAPLALTVVGEARAGTRWEGVLRSGQALRIMTGGPLPDGADTVVRVEDTDREQTSGRVWIHSDRDLGRNVRPGGQDMRAGELLLEAGDRLGAGKLAVAAAAGLARVTVHRRPRVAVLTSGEELRAPDAFEDVRAGRGIPDTNGPMLHAAATELGAESLALGPVPDRVDLVRARLEDASQSEADLLVTVGGASMGRTDLFQEVLRAMGAAVDFWRVRIRPGSPFSAGAIPRAGRAPLPVLGLPGNPVSAFVTFHLFVRPALLTLAGHWHVDLSALTARAGAPLAGGGGLTHFLRVRLESDRGEMVAHPTGLQGSGLVRGLATTDALAIVPPGTERIQEGERASVLLLRLPS